MGDVCQEIVYFFHLPAAERLIRTVLDQNPSHNARGLACHSLAKYLDHQAHVVRKLRCDPVRLPDFQRRPGKLRIQKLPEKDPNTLELEATRFLERAISEFGTVTYGQRTLAELAEGELFERRNLKVGKIAPRLLARMWTGRGSN